MCLFIELDRHVNHCERMNSIDFGGYRSKVKVMMGIIDKCGVRGDATLCFVKFYIKADMKSYTPLETAAIVFLANLCLKQCISSEYDSICMG